MKVLVEFSCTQTLLPFRLPELKTVAAMLGASVTVVDIPSIVATSSAETALSGGDALEASRQEGSFAVLECDGPDTVRALATRCVLAKGWYYLLAHGDSVEGVAAMLSTLSDAPVAGEQPDGIIAQLWSEWRSEGTSFRYQVESVGRRMTDTEKRGVIAQFAEVGHRGPASMRQPDVTFSVFCQYKPTTTATGSTQHERAGGSLVHVYHGVLLAVGARSHMLDVYSLKKRPYIGTTSMPPELTFLMSNFAHVQRNDLVYDPFCGTGSSLVSSAHWGAKVLGTDMDGRVLRSGTGKISVQMRQQQAIAFQAVCERWTEASTGGAHGAAPTGTSTGPEFSPEERQCPSMLTNFKAYGLATTPERVRMNFSRWDHCFAPLVAGKEGFLDAIISDPPYGVREQKRKIDAEQLTATSGPACVVATSIGGAPSTEAYDISDMIVDLFVFAARALVVGGRLTFWLPTTYQYTPDELPCHPCLTLEWDLGQQVTLKMTRRLVTVRKHRSIAAYVSEDNGGLPISRDMCYPKKSTSDIRALLDCVDLPENEAYQHYREKLEKKRSAALAWSEKRDRPTTPHSDDTLSAAQDATQQRFVRPGMSKAEMHAIQVSNRARRIAERAEKEGKKKKSPNLPVTPDAPS